MKMMVFPLVLNVALSHWGKSELFDQRIKWMPQRTESSSRQEISDPFRCILFDDIKPFLIDFGSLDARKGLIESFVQFLFGGVYSKNNTLEPGWAFTRCRDPGSYPYSSVLGKSSVFAFRSSVGTEFGRLFSSDGFPSLSDIEYIKSLGSDWLDFLKFADVILMPQASA